MPAELDTPIKDALALARRVLNPFEEWQSINPLALGLADHQHELDESRLASAYQDVQILAKRGCGVADLQPSTPTSGKSTRTESKPLVKSLQDLKPGMELSGSVSRLASFGAFVNVGLSCEGLVHVSEITDHYIDDPKQVLRVGQQVRAQVLGVDMARQRISLTLRKGRKIEVNDTPVAKPRTSQALSEAIGIHPSRGPKHDEHTTAASRANTSVSRAQALADLEALFNKK